MSAPETGAVVLGAHGGPEQLRWQTIPLPPPSTGEARIRQTAIGLNYIDIYVRTGLYPLLSPPAVIGMEAAGVVTALGPDVKGLSIGDRVAYVAGPGGACCEQRNIAAGQLLHVPAGVSDAQAAAVLLKGLTAEYLLFRTRPVRAGETVLVQAAAGGVGLLLCQWANALGCTVIAAAGGPEKCELARAHGAHHAIDYQNAEVVGEVMKHTGGRGVEVVYDGVGRDSFEASLGSLAVFGHLVSYGQASGAVPNFSVSRLGAKSASLSRPSLFHYIADRNRYLAMGDRLFNAIGDGTLSVTIGRSFPLRECASAHRALEARTTVGSTVLLT